MNGGRLALVAALAFGGLTAAAAAQDLSNGGNLAVRAAEMAGQADIDITVAEAFTPGPAEPPQTLPPAAPAARATFRNPWTSPRPSLREAFSNMAAAFRSEFQAADPPSHSLAAVTGPEPAFEPAHDIDFTVAEAFDARRPAAPSASSHGVAAAARVGAADRNGAARARDLNLASAERGREAAQALAARESAQRDYVEELARWRDRLDP